MKTEYVKYYAHLIIIPNVDKVTRSFYRLKVCCFICLKSSVKKINNGIYTFPSSFSANEAFWEENLIPLASVHIFFKCVYFIIIIMMIIILMLLFHFLAMSLCSYFCNWFRHCSLTCFDVIIFHIYRDFYFLSFIILYNRSFSHHLFSLPWWDSWEARN